jgi:hypothetical protein
MRGVKSRLARVPQALRHEGFRLEAFEFSAKMKDVTAEKTNGPKRLTSKEVSYIGAASGNAGHAIVSVLSEVK